MSTTVAAESQIGSQPELPGGSAITPANLLRMPEGKNYELIYGELATIRCQFIIIASLASSR